MLCDRILSPELTPTSAPLFCPQRALPTHTASWALGLVAPSASTARQAPTPRARRARLHRPPASVRASRWDGYTGMMLTRPESDALSMFTACASGLFSAVDGAACTGNASADGGRGAVPRDRHACGPGSPFSSHTRALGVLTTECPAGAYGANPTGSKSCISMSVQTASRRVATARC